MIGFFIFGVVALSIDIINSTLRSYFDTYFITVSTDGTSGIHLLFALSSFIFFLIVVINFKKIFKRTSKSREKEKFLNKLFTFSWILAVLHLLYCLCYVLAIAFYLQIGYPIGLTTLIFSLHFFTALMQLTHVWFIPTKKSSMVSRSKGTGKGSQKNESINN